MVFQFFNHTRIKIILKLDLNMGNMDNREEPDTVLKLRFC